MANSRNSLTAIGKSTLEILQSTGSYETQDGGTEDIAPLLKTAVAKTKLYHPSELRKLISALLFDKLESGETVFEVTDEKSLSACKRLISEGNSNVLCLNFASAKNPGGGFLGGARAQEESLCRSSGLYQCLVDNRGYYRENRKTHDGIYTDHLIYSPDVPVFRSDDNYDFLDEPYLASFITSPAVNVGAGRGKNPNILKDVEETMLRRIAHVLTVAASNGHDTLVLGAWGCGAFGNDAHQLANLFERNLLGSGKYANVFKRVVFAVFDGKRTDSGNRVAFAKIFVP